jgi:hypothetical protein
MIPSSSVEELEDAFNTAKNALETELSFKEEQLQVSPASPSPSPSSPPGPHRVSRVRVRVVSCRAVCVVCDANS